MFNLKGNRPKIWWQFNDSPNETILHRCIWFVRNKSIKLRDCPSSALLKRKIQILSLLILSKVMFILGFCLISCRSTAISRTCTQYTHIISAYKIAQVHRIRNEIVRSSTIAVECIWTRLRGAYDGTVFYSFFPCLCHSVAIWSKVRLSKDCIDWVYLMEFNP